MLRSKHLNYLSLLPIAQISSADITALPRTPEGSVRKQKLVVEHHRSNPAPRRAGVEYLPLQRQRSLLPQRLRFLISFRQETTERLISSEHSLLSSHRSYWQFWERTGKVSEQILTCVKIPTVVNRCSFQCRQFMYYLKCLKPALYYSPSFSIKTAVNCI